MLIQRYINMFNQLTVSQIIQKLEHYCAYQERCHEEVLGKLRTFTNDPDEMDAVVVHLIAQNYLNEERFARAFARGKHGIKNWGRVRIKMELKKRMISERIIKAALSEIDDDDYLQNFEDVSERHWDSIREKNAMKKRKKFCDYLMRKGYESQLIYNKLNSLESK